MKNNFQSPACECTSLPDLCADAQKSSIENDTVRLIQEGSVLLKNNGNVLPLPHGKKIAVFGITQINTFFGGDGSSITPAITNKIGILQGLQNKASQGKIDLYQPAVDAYQNYCDSASFTLSSPGNFRLYDGEMIPSDSLVCSAAEFTDTAIFVLGRYTTEGHDHLPDEGDYYLSLEERATLTKLKNSFSRLIVIVNAGGGFDANWIKSDDYGVDAALVCWLPGMFAGEAVANMICGDSYPSGKLSDTYALSYDRYPSSSNFRVSPDYENFEEDIFVGYRYFETFDPSYSKVAYEFGYGLSYTDFDIGDVSVQSVDSYSVNVFATVTNVGNRPGKEVVQVYLQAPQGMLGKPAKVLCGFKKTDELAPGQSQRVCVFVNLFDFASYDDAGSVQKSAYILEAGNYNFYVGNSIKNAHQNKVRGTCFVESTVVVKQLTRQLSPCDLSRRLVSDRSYQNIATRSFDDHLPPIDNDNNDQNTDFEWMELAKGTFAGTNSEHRISCDDSATHKSGDCENRHKITLVDVYNGSASMDDLLDSLTVDELCGLASGSMNDANVCAGAVAGFLEQYSVIPLAAADASSGLRTTATVTHYPCGVLVACSWNTDLIYKMGENLAYEMIDDSVAILLGPGMNIHRDPLCGRNFEYYSEDPLLTGITATYMVKGIQSKGVGACLKHFAANTREEERSTVDCRISERALREIYLKGFQICVENAHPWSIMSSYNKINGVETAERYDLLTAVLRNEWGFDGFVMSDYWNDSDIVKMVNAGNNVMMPWDTTPGRNTDENGNCAAVKEAYESGVISRKQIRKNAGEIFKVVMKYYKFLEEVERQKSAAL